MDSEQYPWLYSGWPPKESIGRTDRFVAGASSDIISWRDDSIVVFWVFPNDDVFTLIFPKHFLCFLLPFFFFKVQSKIGVHIIHGHTLYTGKYSKPTQINHEEFPAKPKLISYSVGGATANQHCPDSYSTSPKFHSKFNKNSFWIFK